MEALWKRLALGVGGRGVYTTPPALSVLPHPITVGLSLPQLTTLPPSPPSVELADEESFLSGGRVHIKAVEIHSMCVCVLVRVCALRPGTAHTVLELSVQGTAARERRERRDPLPLYLQPALPLLPSAQCSCPIPSLLCHNFNTLLPHRAERSHSLRSPTIYSSLPSSPLCAQQQLQHPHASAALLHLQGCVNTQNSK